MSGRGGGEGAFFCWGLVPRVFCRLLTLRGIRDVWALNQRHVESKRLAWHRVEQLRIA